MKIQIRNAWPQDAPDILAIYAPYITKTAITFEVTVPSLQEFENRVQNIAQHFPYIVAVYQNQIIGYAYAACFKDRAAYNISAEVSIYIKKDMQHKGVGKLLMLELEKQMLLKGIYNSYACITSSPRENDKYHNNISILFHTAMGYSLVGKFIRCAKKFGLFYDMVYMQKHLVPLSKTSE